MKHEPEYAGALYGDTVKEYLRRWDAGQAVWTIEMGGLGPGYEQALQISMMEVLRYLDAEQIDVEPVFDKRDESRAFFDQISEWSQTNPIIGKLGLSGAQWSAAFNLALNIYRKGPAGLLNSDMFEDRKIQVSRNFPTADGAWKPTA
jgi:hypothetical protein